MLEEWLGPVQRTCTSIHNQMFALWCFTFKKITAKNKKRINLQRHDYGIKLSRFKITNLTNTVKFDCDRTIYSECMRLHV